MDNYVKDDSYLTFEWKGNIFADELAEEFYEGGERIDTHSLTLKMEGVIRQEGRTVVVRFKKWARDQVRMRRIKRFFKRHPSALKGIEIDWGSMLSVSKGRKVFWQKVKAMRIIHKLYAFQHTKMLRKHCLPCENKCAFCGAWVETQDHVLNCKDPRVANIRQHMHGDLTKLILSHVRDTDMKGWIQAYMDDIWKGGIDQMPEWGPELSDTMQGVDFSVISASLLDGTIPSGVGTDLS